MFSCEENFPTPPRNIRIHFPLFSKKGSLHFKKMGLSICREEKVYFSWISLGRRCLPHFLRLVLRGLTRLTLPDCQICQTDQWSALSSNLPV